MSLVIRRIGLENFRKFRAPLAIEGLGAGLNIVIEPNETGKSTVMEAVRAALFLRHTSATQQIKAFQPHGDDVAPHISLDFTLDSGDYSLTKRFLKQKQAELTRPDGSRVSGAEAEDALQELLGFEQGGFDTKLSGVLGMLWVAQTEGLTIEAPAGRVTSLIGNSLEQQAGALLGSAHFDAVSARIEAQCATLMTRTGKPAANGAWKKALDRHEKASANLAEIEQRAQALEQAFEELEQANRRLASIERDIDPAADAQTRKDLTDKLEAARSAAQTLRVHEAEVTRCQDALDKLTALDERHRSAAQALEDANETLQRARADMDAHAGKLAEARSRKDTTKRALDDARTARENARKAQQEGARRISAQRRAQRIQAAHERHRAICTLQEEREGLLALAQNAPPADLADELERLEQALARHSAMLEAGGTRVELIGEADGLLCDGAPMEPGEWSVLRETRIALPGGGELVLRPPLALANAHEALDETKASLAALCKAHGVSGSREAREHALKSKAAQLDADKLAKRIAGEAPADSELDLAAGPQALADFVTTHPLTADSAGEEDQPLPDMQALDAALHEAEETFTRADADHQLAQQALDTSVEAHTPLQVAKGTAQSALEHAERDRIAIESDPAFADREERLTRAREALTMKSHEHRKAQDLAQGLDPASVERQLTAHEARTRAAQQDARNIKEEVIRLGAKVESGGGQGLGEKLAAARDELSDAAQALDRVELDVATLKLLRGTLEETRSQSAQTITGPVARRAARYVDRILPGAQADFDEDLALGILRRHGREEATGTLSHGTQEQLAILSRLAFAEMLHEKGHPVSLILDDPLVYADDMRLDAMLDLLGEVAKTMQVIVLTCRERAFRHLEANRIRL